MPLTELQREYLRRCSHRWNIKTGATGSGKSYVDCAVTIPKRILAARGEGLLVLMGNTRGTLERNILEPMRALWPEQVGALRQDNTITLFGRKVYALGADNKKHVARIQGASMEYVYGDEITTWSQEVFQMLKSRLRCPHSHFDGTCNPASPSHWFKQFLDSGADIYCQSYTIDDGCLPPEVVAQLKQEYRGTAYYAWYILGQWAAAEGLIYRPFADSIARGDGRFFWPGDRPLRPLRLHVGVDFGGSGSRHAFVAAAILPGHAGIVGLQSALVDARETDAGALCRALVDFLRSVRGRWGEIDALYCDSAEQVLIQSIRSALSAQVEWQDLSRRVCNARKSPILDRIRLTAALMGGGRLWVTPSADSLIQALSTALWAQGPCRQETRLDNGTTDIDTLDAFEYTFEREAVRLLRRPQI